MEHALLLPPSPLPSTLLKGTKIYPEQSNTMIVPKMKWPLIISDLQNKLFKCEEDIPFESAILLDHRIDKTQVHWDLIPIGRQPESCFQCDVFSLLPFLSNENFCLEESRLPYLRFTSFIANLEAVVCNVAAPQMRVLRLPTSAT